MTEPVKLEITLDLDRYLVKFSGYNEDGEEIVAPQTIEDVVLAAAARQVVASLPKEVMSSLSSLVSQIRREEIHRAVRPIIEEALTAPLTRTNTWGEPIAGQTTTIRDIIIAEAQGWLTTVNQQSSNRGGTKTNVRAIIAEQVDAAFKKELSEAIAQAKAEVTAAVKERASAVLAGTIVDMAEAAR